MSGKKQLFIGPPKPNGTMVEYLYRDAGNYKFWGEFFLSGTVTFAEIEGLLFDRFWFIPEEIGVESLTPKIRNEDDHPFHEIHEMTLVPVTNALMTAADFVARLEGARFPDYLFRANSAKVDDIDVRDWSQIIDLMRFHFGELIPTRRNVR